MVWVSLIGSHEGSHYWESLKIIQPNGAHRSEAWSSSIQNSLGTLELLDLGFMVLLMEEILHLACKKPSK